MFERTREAVAAVAWSRDDRLPAVPVREPVVRHPSLQGLAAFDWGLRHRFALKRLMAALSGRLQEPGALRAGDIDTGILRRTVTELLGSHSGQQAGVDGVTAPVIGEPTVEQVMALLLGAYVALPAASGRRAVAVAAATAGRLGVPVHVCCADADAATALAGAIQALLPAEPLVPVVLLGEKQADGASLSRWPAQGIVCAPLTVLTHAWLRVGGAVTAVARAAATLGGNARPVFPYAPLLLLEEGDALLLDLVRHPLQITDDVAEDAMRIVQQALALVADWQAGVEYEADKPTAAGQEIIAGAVRDLGGAWAVPRERAQAVQAALLVKGIEEGRDYRLEGSSIQWLVDDLVDEELRVAVERALRCRHGKGGRRVRRRASMLDFLAGYARLGATGPVLGEEWRDLWVLHGIPVWQGSRTEPEVCWAQVPARSMAADAPADGASLLFAASRRLTGKDGPLPADTPSLDQPEARRLLESALAEGRGVCVVGIPLAVRHVPAGVSVIMLAADDPMLFPLVAPLARLAGRLGAPGRVIQRWLAAYLARQTHKKRYRTRLQLALRREQERKTWAFAAGARTSEQERT